MIVMLTLSVAMVEIERVRGKDGFPVFDIWCIRSRFRGHFVFVLYLFSHECTTVRILGAFQFYERYRWLGIDHIDLISSLTITDYKIIV